MAPTLGYWKFRGLGQPIRLLLEYTGQQYDEKLYKYGPAPDYDKSDWLQQKNLLGLDMPNLPYYIDGDLRLTQSNAIMYHIGRQHNLCGTTEKDKSHVDMLVHQVGDLKMKYGWCVYFNDSEQEKEEYVKELPDQLKIFSNYLANKSWFVGDKITIVDFMIYEILDVQTHFVPNCLNNFKNLQDFLIRFEALPAIKQYMASSKYIKKPINAAYAKWDIK